MGNKSVDDYITEGIYGTQRPKEAERRQFLGTLRERIVLALTIGQVMTDSGISELEKAMKKHPQTKLLINGQVSHRFLAAEKAIANKYDIPYTIISNEEYETDIGAVLTYDHAIDMENIYIEVQKDEDKEDKETNSLFSTIKNWFTSK